MTGPQARYLREISRWQGMGPDTKQVVGCQGAALDAVVNACQRRGWITWRTNGPELTPAGAEALETHHARI